MRSGVPSVGRAVLAISAAVALAGCATFINEDTRALTVLSEPQGAAVTLDGRRVGVTPLIVKASNKEHTIVVEAPGFAPRMCVLGASVGAGWVVADIVLAFIVVGVIIDAATDDWTSLDDTRCYLVLAPAAGGGPAPGATPTP